MLMKIYVKVVTNAKKAEVAKDNGGYRIRVTSKPEKGKANREVIELLAKYFGKSKSEIRILAGEKSRSKIIEIL